MELSGERLIAAPVEKVWSALHDAAILKASIPGCESIEQLSDTETQAIASLSLGPIAARFTGKFALSEVNPPNSYKISGETHGGVAGSATGGVSLYLSNTQDGTRLAYAISAEPAGKIAALDPKTFETSARDLVEGFFTKFTALVGPAAPAHHEFNAASPYHELAEDHDHDPSNPHYFGLPVGVIIAATVAMVSVALTILKFVHIE